MPKMKLKHCIETNLPDPGPCTVDISSAAGPGRVEVLSPGSGTVHGMVVVPGAGPPVAVPEPGTVAVHYYAEDGAPAEIEADVTQS